MNRIENNSILRIETISKCIKRANSVVKEDGSSFSGMLTDRVDLRRMCFMTYKYLDLIDSIKKVNSDLENALELDSKLNTGNPEKKSIILATIGDLQNLVGSL